MAASLYDKKAVKILFETYWSAAGWKKNPAAAPDDFAYAKAKGVMFDPRTLLHDEMVEMAKASTANTDAHAVGNAFLASLGSRELAYRSALGSFATARWLPSHRHQMKRFAFACSKCGEHLEQQDQDLSCLNFERLKWGGVRHLAPYFAWFDLSEFAKLPLAKPSDADREILKRILDAVSSQPTDARPVDMEKAIAGLFPSSKDERRKVLEVLGYCGILQPAGHPSFFQTYAEFDSRKEPDEHKNDWNFPFLWWRGSDGVNSKAVEFYFPGLR